MVQVKRDTWTNANPAVARNVDVGFEPVQVIVIDITNGGSWEWIKGLGDGYYLDVDAGTVTTSNGFTPLAQGGRYAGAVTNITAANPAVITVTNASDFSFATGDTIKVTNVADDLTGTTLNGDYTIASVSGDSITTATDTSSGYSAYVSGGFASRETDTNGDAVATSNQAIRGGTLGTGMVGAASASMVAIFIGEEPVT